MLHRDALLSNIEEQIKLDGNKKIFKKYPLLDNDTCLWPEKFDSVERINELKSLVNNQIVWDREYLLLETYLGQQIIKPEQIKYYDAIPMHKKSTRNIYRITMGVDLATSESAFADYTSCVMVMELKNDEDDYHYYVLPQIAHLKGSYLQIVKTMQELSMVTSARWNRSVDIHIENVGMQAMVIQSIRSYPGSRLSIHDYKPIGSKMERLYTVSPLFENGKVFFPRTGAEELINEILGFPNERHDDLLDAFTSAIIPRLVERSKYGTVCIV
jgi:predicted phage terminase large subunit-like protein